MRTFKGEQIKKILENPGRRSSITKKNIVKLAKKCGLDIVFQVDRWGKNNEYNCKFAQDYITCITKKPSMNYSNSDFRKKTSTALKKKAV